MQKSLQPYTAIGSELIMKNKDVALSQLFGMPTLKINGKAFSGLYNDDMVFKLQGDHHANALRIKGAKLFDPGMGRTMKEWVQVPLKFSDQWKSLAEAALSYVAAMPEKNKKVRKTTVKKK